MVASGSRGGVAAGNLAYEAAAGSRLSSLATLPLLSVHDGEASTHLTELSDDIRATPLVAGSEDSVQATSALDFGMVARASSLFAGLPETLHAVQQVSRCEESGTQELKLVLWPVRRW